MDPHTTIRIALFVLALALGAAALVVAMKQARNGVTKEKDQ